MIRHTAERMIGVVLVSALVLAALGSWLLIKDQLALQLDRRLREARAVVGTRLGELQGRIDQLEAEIVSEQQRVMRSEKVMTSLRQLKSTWDWFGENRAQQQANRERFEKMQALHDAAVVRLNGLQQELRQVKWERNGCEIDRDRLDEQLRAEEQKKSEVGYQVGRVWLMLRSWLVLGIAAYLLGPVLVPVWLSRHRRRRATAA